MMRYWKLTAAVFAAGLSLLAASTAAASGPVALDILKLPEWEMTSNSYGGKLLLSDSPEMVSADGIMYRDTVEGDVRLFYHHVNATNTAKRIVVLLENSSDTPANVTVHQYGVSGPDRDWTAVGKNAQLAYLEGGEIYLVEVPAKGAAPLSTAVNDAVVQPNELVNGIFDFKADRPVTVKVMMLPVRADVGKFAGSAAVLPPDEQRLRGTFAGKDRMLLPLKVYDPAQHGAVVVTLGDNLTDRYVEGVDATTGEKVLNYGNYGVVYKLFLPSGGQNRISYYLNPRGGDYAGGIGVKHRHVLLPPVLTPADRVVFGSNKTTDFASIGAFGGGDSLWFTFSPPGASNLPVKLVIFPEYK